MKRADNKDVARLTFASITRPINAALAGAGTLFAVAGMHSPLLAVVGFGMLVATGASVTRDLTNKQFLEEALGDGTDPKALPEIPESVAGQYRMACLDAKRHLEKTTETMEAAGPDMFEELRPMRDQISELVESVYRLAERAHRTDADLTANSRNEIIKDTEKIKAQLVLASDAVTRQHLEATRRQKEEALSSYDELALGVKRIQAQMQYINASLGNIEFKVMKITSADLKSGASQVDEITQSVQHVLNEVTLFERSLDSAYSDDPRLSSAGSLESWDERANQRNRLPAINRTEVNRTEAGPEQNGPDQNGNQPNGAS